MKPIPEAEALRRREMEDQYGLLNLSPSHVELTRRRFPESVRQMAKCKPYHFMFYVWWMLYLFSYYVFFWILSSRSGGLRASLLGTRNPACADD